MVTSNRERLVGIGVGAVLVLWILNQFVLNPYMDDRKKSLAALTAANDTLLANKETVKKHGLYQRKWDQMVQDGMKTVPAESASQLERSVRDWALLSKVTPSETKLDQMPPDKSFQKFKFHFTGTGSERSISTMLWALETTALPVRLDDVTVSAIKDGTDSLKIELDVFVICPLKDNPAPAKTSVASATGA